MKSALPDRFDAARASLQEAGEAYAVATVVRTVDATSAKPGAKALVLADGTIAEGWIGGGCARGVVGRAAQACIRSGVPQLVSLRPADLLDAEGVVPGETRDGARFAASHCPSRGSMDIFVEPVLPRPRLVVLGSGPVALALCDLAARFDLHRTMAAPGLTDGPADIVADNLDAALAGPRPSFLVVATQGRGDEAGLRAAVSSQAPYVAFVGSRRKFATLAERLLGGGLDAQALARIHAPAGLDICAITPEEIALSILAEITRHRREGGRGVAGRGPDASDALTDAPPLTTAVVASSPALPEPARSEARPLLARIMRRLFAPLSAEQSETIASIRYPCC
jgi:xanthine dehydrogenase accessory factor